MRWAGLNLVRSPRLQITVHGWRSPSASARDTCVSKKGHSSPRDVWTHILLSASLGAQKHTSIQRSIQRPRALTGLNANTQTNKEKN